MPSREFIRVIVEAENEQEPIPLQGHPAARPLSDLIVALGESRIADMPNCPAVNGLLLTVTDLAHQIIGTHGTRRQAGAYSNLMRKLLNEWSVSIEPVHGPRAQRLPEPVQLLIMEMMSRRLKALETAFSTLEDAKLAYDERRDESTVLGMRKAQERMRLLGKDTEGDTCVPPSTSGEKPFYYPFGLVVPYERTALGDELLDEKPKVRAQPKPTGRFGRLIKNLSGAAPENQVPAEHSSPAQEPRPAEPVAVLDPDQQIAVARASFAGLEQAWLEYTLDTEDYFLRRPALRDNGEDADPAIAAYHQSYLLASQIISEFPASPERDARITRSQSDSVAAAVAKAWAAWDDACRRALELGTSDLEPEITAASRRAVALIKILSDPGTTGSYREHVAAELNRKIDVLADPGRSAHTPVDRRVVLSMPELGESAALLQLTRGAER